MVKIAYNRENYNRCLCGGCPVNRSSECVQEREKKVSTQTDSIQDKGDMPDKTDFPGIYCAVGKSRCNDIDSSRACLCPACSVQLKNNLTGTHYCVRGSVEETS